MLGVPQETALLAELVFLDGKFPGGIPSSLEKNAGLAAADPRGLAAWDFSICEYRASRLANPRGLARVHNRVLSSL